ncbi:hypothetical protein JX266_003757 [Neoarthrinium moseri]|nr:hypothetical protein JX266_003757 [Neoarthrinium moseri]
MASKPLLQQLFVWASISLVKAYDITLPGATSPFIPSCAQSCLTSFINDDTFFKASGFTLGEGAMTCVVGLNYSCQASNNNATAALASNAYNVCSGQPSAVTPTHPTLTASLEIQTSSATAIIIVIEPSRIPPTTSGIVVSTTSSSTLETATNPPTTFMTVTPGTTTPAKTSSSTTSPTVTASPQTTESSQPAPARLGTPQIVGVSVGVAGAIVLALLAICLARRARRRKYPDMDTEGFFPMDEKSSFGGGGGGGAGGGVVARISRIFHISPPILRQPTREEPPVPPAPSEYYNVDRSTIGLAISRPRSEVAPKQSSPRVERRASKLLPPKPLRPVKPNLTLNIPNAIHPALRPQSSQPQTDRTSTMTNMTAFADLDTEAAEGAQVWRPPPPDPQSANAYYVADKWGNWVLSNNNRQSQVAQVTEVAELDTYTPLTKSPIEKQEEAAVAMAAAISAASSSYLARPQPALVKTGVEPNMSRSSSLYSQASAVRPPGRTLAPVPNRNYGPRQGRSNSKASMDSATTIATSSSFGGPYDDDPPVEAEPGHLSVLSPVVESPRTPTGRSPVKYPKIPGRLDPATIRLVPPPQRPNFAASPPGQPSPTLGAVMPVRGSPSAYPPPLNPRRSMQPAERSNQGYMVQPPSGSGFSPTRAPIPKFPSPPPNVPARSEKRLSRQNMPRLDTNNLPPPRAHISSYISPTSAVTTSSTASSLLAKRLGNERAAALSLENNQRRAAAAGPWKRQGGPPGSAGLLSPEMAAMMSPRGLPATPTWQPKLTPTRRGDDLFLNVQ